MAAVSGDAGYYEFESGEPVRDALTGLTGRVVELGEEQALVRLPLLGDYWIPYGELLPGGRVIGEG